VTVAADSRDLAALVDDIGALVRNAKPSVPTRVVVSREICELLDLVMAQLSVAIVEVRRRRKQRDAEELPVLPEPQGGLESLFDAMTSLGDLVSGRRSADIWYWNRGQVVNQTKQLAAWQRFDAAAAPWVEQVRYYR
jgi:hypothetical protein